MKSNKFSLFFAYCALFTAVQSAPINRFNRMLSDETECGPNEDFYRDPTKVLGPRFSRFMMTKLCETNVWLAPGSVITKVRHTRLGDQVCRDVCARHRDNMCRNQCTPVKVSTLNAYCELHGTSDGPVNVEHVGNTCECLYKVKSDKTSEVVQYTFETNPLGDVRVSVVNSDRRCFVTAMYPSPAQYLQEPRFPTDG